MFRKDVENGFIVAVGTGIAGTEITETEYNEILSAVNSKPTTPKGYEYLLSDSLEWVLVESPQEPEPDEITEEEAFEILIGGAE